MNSRTTLPPSHLPPQEARKPQKKPSLSSPLRPFNLCGTLLLALVIPHSPFVIAAPPPELTILRQQYERVLAEKATAPFDASLALLNSKFTTALDNATTAAQQSGKLDDVLAIQDDKKRLTEKLPIPDDDEKTPAALKTLRAIYREQLKKLEDNRTAAIASVLPAYQTKLQDLEATLTKAARIDEAKELRTYREGLAQSGPLSPLSGAPQTPPPATAAISNAPKVKGDDRKAAEWLIKVGGHFEIDEKGKKSKPLKPEDLPKGKFVISSISLDGRFTKEAITADGLANLRGLEELRSLLAGELVLTDSDMSFISTCPALEYITLSQRMQITDDIVELLLPLKALKQLKVSDVREFTGAKLDRLTGIKTLASFEFTGTGFNAAGAEAVSRLKQINGLLLEHCHAFTDEGLIHLSKLPDLSRLQMANSGCTAAGLAAAKLKVTSLDFNKLSDKLPRETAPIVGPACSAVTHIRLSLSELLTQEDFEALSHFKSLRSLFVYAVNDTTAWAGLAKLTTLEFITFDRNPFSDTEVDHLLQVPSLTSLTFMNVDVTDAGLMKLASLKKLKQIYLKPCPKVTDAGIAALKKKRPDIQITR